MEGIKFICILGFTFMINAVHAQAKNNALHGVNFYLVRHAEKDTGNNPGLTKSGYERAGDLYRVLKNKKIGQVYFTQYQRTRLTGDSLRIYLNTDTVSYKADTTGQDILKKIKERHGKQKNILVIGHSNTIPAIIKKLGADPGIKDIPDNEFDHLYIVRIKKNKVLLKKMKYGKASVSKKEM